MTAEPLLRYGKRTARLTGRLILCEHRAFEGAKKDATPASVTQRLSTIRKRADFLRANRGLRVAKPGFVLLVHPNDGAGKRFGVTVTKRIGNAVVRNRMKRRFRELLRAALPQNGLPDHDHILIGREGGVERDFAAMVSELENALERAASGKGDPPRSRRKPKGGGRRKGMPARPAASQ